MHRSLLQSSRALGLVLLIAGFPATLVLGAAPANDAFASSQVLTGSSGSITGTNVGATKEAGEPNHAGNSGGHSVWYQWTAPASGTVVFDTVGSNFDTLLAIYRGTSVSCLTAVASNDDIADPTIVQ